MFTHVDKPIVIRNIEIKNRVVRGAATSVLGGGTISEDLIAYHEARARGGVGLSVLDIMNIHPSSRIPINSFDPRMGDVYPPMIQRLKAHGMRVFQQLWHGGRNTLALDGGPSWAPSAIPGPSIGVVPMAMTKGMIDELIAAFATLRTNASCGASTASSSMLHTAIWLRSFSRPTPIRAPTSMAVRWRTARAL